MYAEMAATYADETTRARISACCHEQALLMAAGPEGSATTLALHVIGGDSSDIDALTYAVCTGPNWNSLTEDPALLAAVQSAWPTVAAARYPGTPA